MLLLQKRRGSEQSLGLDINGSGHTTHDMSESGAVRDAVGILKKFEYCRDPREKKTDSIMPLKHVSSLHVSSKDNEIVRDEVRVFSSKRVKLSLT